ncbi:MAG: hypothetical protein NDJ89_07480 [Oligoflexia bacterium]|nr:hypothetical protein [Oligoflexia bacterium]
MNHWLFTVSMLLPALAMSTFADDNWNPETGPADVAALTKSLEEVKKGMNELKPVKPDCDSQSDNTPPSKVPLFQSDEILKVEMRGIFPIRDTIQPRPGKIIVGHNGQEHTTSADFVGRGQYRRSLCSEFPPFKIILPASDQKGSLFKGGDRDLKFVTHCGSKPENAERVREEYTIYKVLSAAGLLSLKVRLAEVTYTNSQGTQTATGPGFFIENLKDAAKRWEGREPKALSAEQDGNYFGGVARVSELIATNNDFSVEAEHNTRIVRDAKGNRRYAIPYDFDLTDLIVGKNYGKNTWDSQDVEKKIRNLLLENGSASAREALETATRNRKSVHRAIDESPISEANKRKFHGRMDFFFDAAEAVLQGAPPQVRVVPDELRGTAKFQ